MTNSIVHKFMRIFKFLKIKKLSFSLPFGIGSVELEPDPIKSKAAWSIYVELVTRIAVEPLETDQGLLREALKSLHDLFSITREVLKQAGSDVGSVGGIAIAVLNNGLRPFLAKWHPLLQTWEAQRPPHLSAKEHERNWSEETKLRAELELLRKDLEKYANALAEIAGVKEKQLEGHQDQVHSIAFIKNTEGLVFPKEQENPPENQEIKPFLVSSGFDRQLILWGINHNNTSVEKLCSVNEGQRILSVACHPTELIIASAGHDRIIILWKIEKNEKNEYVFKKIKILKGHKRAVESIVFTPDCKRLISCGQDQTIRFWDVEVDKNKKISKINTSIHTIELGKPYQDMNISGVKNLDDTQISALKELGASRD
ncbi:MAG: hypothetical protein HEQ26_02925 [Dolichospermum sp. DL01]|nr:MAG: hypothetical protein HEQ26_02925 [Dolichospermum sp. DL01]